MEDDDVYVKCKITSSLKILGKNEIQDKNSKYLN